MAYNNILFRIENNLATLVINRPEKLNALNFETLKELDQVLDEIAENKAIRGLIITGSGEKAFVAGADISEFTTLDQNNAKAVAENGQRIFMKIENLRLPVVAAVNGYALGGGCELALACHIRVATENAVFGQPEVNLGIIPGYGGTQRLTHLVGRGKAIELIATADNVKADEALRLGLVNYVVEKTQLIEKSTEILNKIAQKPAISVGLAIAAINEAVNNPTNGYELEAVNFAKSAITKDFSEGTAAFLEKRKPNFKGE